MMQIFPYIFYTFSKMYRAGLDKRDPHIYACGLLSLMQSFNVITITNLKLDGKSEPIAWISLSLFIAVLGMFFFNAKTLQIFDERWDGEPRKKRLIKRTLVIIYSIGSVVSFLVWGFMQEW